MSGPPQTPGQYTPNRQFITRPGQPPIAMVSPTQQRPNIMPYRPGMTPQQLSQQQMYIPSAGRGAPPTGLTPQQVHQQQTHYNQQLQAQVLHQKQQQQVMGSPIRPGMPPQMPGIHPGMSAHGHMQNTGQGMGVVGVGIPGQQPHPALIQPQQAHNAHQHGRKRKAKGTQEAPTGDDGGNESGDELDQLQPYNIAVTRYQNNHNLMAEIFVALPTNTVEIPKHYYEELNEKSIKDSLSSLENSVEQCEKEHETKIDTIKKQRNEFSNLLDALMNTDADKIDTIKERLGSEFDMEFVDNPYNTVERVPISNIETVSNPVYKQL